MIPADHLLEFFPLLFDFVIQFQDGVETRAAFLEGIPITVE